MRTIAIALLTGLSACSLNFGDDVKGPGVTGRGGGTTRVFAVEDFSGVALKGADNVDVRVGAGFSVRAEGPSDELDKLRIARDDDTLSVGRRQGMSWGRHDPVRIIVTMPRLAAAMVAGSGDLRVDRVEGSAFAGSIAGSGNLAIGTVALDTMTVKVAGSGTMTAAGSVASVAVDLAGSGDFDAKRLVAREADVKIAGSGSVNVAVDGPASVRVMGSGDVDLGPKATCDVKKMGSGSVRCG